MSCNRFHTCPRPVHGLTPRVVKPAKYCHEVGLVMRRWPGLLLFILLSAKALGAEPRVSGGKSFFPIGVWLQSPANADRYRAAGINTYVGLWQGPTAAQLSELAAANIRVMCFQNETALQHPAATNIIAWMQPDEPDNAQAWGARLGLGEPTPPSKIRADYEQLKARDATRPIFLNLGQGVAWDNWYGRGSRNGHPEDYASYLEGCDIASFDIYPVNHPAPEVAGNLWYVPDGVTQLRRLTRDTKPVWNFIECTGIHRPAGKPTPLQVRAQVWMSLIHGSRGIIYFVHQFEPKFVEAALLADPEMLAAVTQINHQITSLASALNSPTSTNILSVQSTNRAAPIASMVKHVGGFTYIFAVAMRPLETEATFKLENHFQATDVEVVGENRTLPLAQGKFSDHFDPWAVHLYRVKNLSAR
jgi:hypothetical protein